MKIYERIKNQEVAFWAAIGTIMLVQAPHLMMVFKEMSQFSSPFNWFHSVAYAVFVDLGVLFFAVRGKKLQTILFMTASAVITLRYYWEHVEGDWFNYVTVILMGVIPSVIVYFVSEELNEKQFSKDDVDAKILSMKKDGKTYREIMDELKDHKVSTNRISRVIKDAGI